MKEFERRKIRRGFLNPDVVRAISFWTTSTCILVAVVACLLAIWKFAGSDILWRTVATCAVIGGGMIACYVGNSICERGAEDTNGKETSAKGKQIEGKPGLERT